MTDNRTTETATDRLRALLDEHDVAHYDGAERTLWGYEPICEDTGIYRYAASEISGGFLQFDMFRVTPEQAIAVTLGSVTCEFNVVEEFIPGKRQRSNICECSNCGYRCAYGFIVDECFKCCPNCGKRIRKKVEE